MLNVHHVYVYLIEKKKQNIMLSKSSKIFSEKSGKSEKNLNPVISHTSD